jgi:hypothetical protein
MKKEVTPVTRIWIFLLMLPLIWGCSGMGTNAAQAEAPRITKEELKPMLGSPDLVLLDVRGGKDWTDSDMKIKGAIRENPKDFSDWSGKYPKDKTLVLYCD